MCKNPVSEQFSAEPAQFKSKNLIQLRSIASPEYIKFVYLQFFFFVIILRS